MDSSITCTPDNRYGFKYHLNTGYSIWYVGCMKAIQITFEEDLLNDLDADETVKEIGRSALLRQLAREYLRRERERRIDEQYARAYGGNGGEDPDGGAWEKEGDWPPEPEEGGK